jgi:triacylglycerol lipase
MPIVEPPVPVCVVLLHGLGRTTFSMAAMAGDFRRAGYYVVNQGYPSQRKTLLELSEYVEHAVQRCVGLATAGMRNADAHISSPTPVVHFVTHSMGAMLLRQYFAQRRQTTAQASTNYQFGRAVLLGPPNHGSEIVDAWGGRRWFRWILGPAAVGLSTHASGTPALLPTLPIRFAVIAGQSATPNWFLPKISGPNDGKVSVASAQLDGMADLAKVNVDHTWLAQNRHVRALTMKFIQNGAF